MPNETYTTAALKERGWTKSMITALLPAPNERPNPYNRKQTIKSWPAAVVEAAEQTDEYKAAVQKASKRRAAAQKAAETRAEKTAEYAAQAAQYITVPDIGINRLYQNAIDSRCDYAFDRGEYIDPFDVPPEVLDRWAVNYARHELTNYDAALEYLKGRTGVSEAHDILKTAILNKIAEVYPDLAAACAEQQPR